MTPITVIRDIPDPRPASSASILPDLFDLSDIPGSWCLWALSVIIDLLLIYYLSALDDPKRPTQTGQFELRIRFNTNWCLFLLFLALAGLGYWAGNRLMKRWNKTRR